MSKQTFCFLFLFFYTDKFNEIFHVTNAQHPHLTGCEYRYFNPKRLHSKAIYLSLFISFGEQNRILTLFDAFFVMHSILKKIKCLSIYIRQFPKRNAHTHVNFKQTTGAKNHCKIFYFLCVYMFNKIIFFFYNFKLFFNFFFYQKEAITHSLLLFFSCCKN